MTVRSGSRCYYCGKIVNPNSNYGAMENLSGDVCCASCNRAHLKPLRDKFIRNNQDDIYRLRRVTGYKPKKK